MLFYGASGKRQRTCDECLKRGGRAPAESLADPALQVGLFDLLVEKKKLMDLEALEAAAEVRRHTPPPSPPLPPPAAAAAAAFL